jgi:hypothetical protein
MRPRAAIIPLSIAAGLTGTVLFAISAFSATPGPLFASPVGQNEIPDADPDGSGGFNATIDGSQFCFGITVKNIDQPVAAHIHRGNARTNGPVVITLTHPATGDPGASSGCTNASTELLQEIQQNPSQFYVNVHTTTFPNGAIRDQLVRHPR